MMRPFFFVFSSFFVFLFLSSSVIATSPVFVSPTSSSQMSLNILRSDSFDELEKLRKSMLQLMPGGILLLADQQGSLVIEYNINKPLIPASLSKYFTSLASLELLGKNYRFQTDFYQNEKKDLLIYGWGDPYLTSREIQTIAKKLKQEGIKKIRSIHLDTSSFREILITGVSNNIQNYNALNSALLVNFSSFSIIKDKQGKIFSGDKTPLTPLGEEKARALKKGQKRRVRVGYRPKENLRYTGELFAMIFAKMGIQVQQKKIKASKLNPKIWKKAYEHFSTKNISFIIRMMMRHSNNFVANQLFLTIGADEEGYPASLKKSQKIFDDYFAKRFRLEEEDLLLSEGSGLSRKNRLSGKAMLRMLFSFQNYKNLLSKKHGVLLKSGTLTGVYNYAGYLFSEKGDFPFVIMMNQKKNQREKVLELLKQYQKLWIQSTQKRKTQSQLAKRP